MTGASPRAADLHTEIAAPGLVIGARHDWICPPDQSERIHAGLPASRLVVLEGSGHFPWLEERDAFLGAVRELLA